MTGTKPNAELAYRVLDHIDAHPEQWEQQVYIGKADCGTIACFAGWACLLSGDKPYFAQGYDRTALLQDSDYSLVDRRAEVLLGVSRYLDKASELGYNRDLFAANNTRDDLGTMVLELFGPRPEVQA